MLNGHLGSNHTQKMRCLDKKTHNGPMAQSYISSMSKCTHNVVRAQSVGSLLNTMNGGSGLLYAELT